MIEGSMYIFGGYDGTKCVTDFRKLAISLPVIDMAKVCRERDVKDQVRYAFRHFAKTSTASISEKELETLFTNLSSGLQKSSGGPGAGSTGSSSGTTGNTSTSPTGTTTATDASAFDPSVVQDACKIGFSREAVLATLQSMQSQGQDTTNLNLLLDKLMAGDTGSATDTEPKSNPALDRQKSERTELKEKIASLDEMRTCRVCMEVAMDCAMQPCGHLSVCMKCAEDLRKKSLPCVICRKRITGLLRVYWS